MAHFCSDCNVPRVAGLDTVMCTDVDGVLPGGSVPWKDLTKVLVPEWVCPVCKVVASVLGVEDFTRWAETWLVQQKRGEVNL